MEDARDFIIRLEIEIEKAEESLKSDKEKSSHRTREPTEWPVFWGKFERNIDQRKDLSPADKLSCLLMFLEGPPLDNPDEIAKKLFCQLEHIPDTRRQLEPLPTFLAAETILQKIDAVGTEAGKTIASNMKLETGEETAKNGSNFIMAAVNTAYNVRKQFKSKEKSVENVAHLALETSDEERDDGRIQEIMEMQIPNREQPLSVYSGRGSQESAS
uniref:Uncharacterized protein n=1 Tax=Syphacia muris TaxID=451379 RepID=A0A0N5B1I5_9BILA